MESEEKSIFKTKTFIFFLSELEEQEDRDSYSLQYSGIQDSKQKLTQQIAIIYHLHP